MPDGCMGKGGPRTNNRLLIDGRPGTKPQVGNPVSLLARPAIGQGSFGARLIEGFACRFVTADRAYDAEHFHDTILDAGAEPVIPPRPNRRKPHAYDKDLYKERNLVERFLNNSSSFDVSHPATTSCC